MTTEPRDTRRRLLDAATDEFAVYGLQGARMHAIVKRARINERMFYHHFGSKVGLYRAVLADQWGSNAGALTVKAPERPSVESFEASLRAVLLGVSSRPKFLALVLHESLNGWKYLPAVSVGSQQHLVKQYQALQKKKVFSAEVRFDTVYLAAFGALVAGRLLSGRFEEFRDVPDSAERQVDDVLGLVLKGARR